MIRKINWSKWKQYDIVNGVYPISADLITHDLVTKNNTLSVWCSESESETHINEALLALATSFSHINTIDIINIKDDDLNNKKLKTNSSEGITFYSAYKDKHYDIINLTYESLGLFAKLIIENPDAVERIRVQRLKQILREGIENKKINRDELSPSIVASL